MYNQKRIFEIAIVATAFLFLLVSILAIISNIRINKKISRYLDFETKARNEEIREQLRFFKFIMEEKQKLNEPPVAEVLKISDEA